jgi:ferredoxin
MAIIKTEYKEIEVPDGEPVKEKCKELGIAFGCESGSCGTCRVEVLEGKENLSEFSEAEKMNGEFLGVDEDHRLMCQCKIKEGTVKIKQAQQ